MPLTRENAPKLYAHSGYFTARSEIVPHHLENLMYCQGAVRKYGLEDMVYDLRVAQGVQDVESTPMTGDQGIDLFHSRRQGTVCVEQHTASNPRNALYMAKVDEFYGAIARLERRSNLKVVDAALVTLSHAAEITWVETVEHSIRIVDGLMLMAELEEAGIDPRDPKYLRRTKH